MFFTDLNVLCYIIYSVGLLNYLALFCDSIGGE